MGRAPCCDKANVKRGPWSPEEDDKLKSYIEEHGYGGNWIALPQKIGLSRCGKSCRLRWLNYLRPNIRHGGFSEEEDRVICTLYVSIGSRWSIIAAQLPGRTDNDIKNYWNTKLKKKLLGKQRKDLDHHFSSIGRKLKKIALDGNIHGVSNPSYNSMPINQDQVMIPHWPSNPELDEYSSMRSLLMKLGGAPTNGYDHQTMYNLHPSFPTTADLPQISNQLMDMVASDGVVSNYNDLDGLVNNTFPASQRMINGLDYTAWEEMMMINGNASGGGGGGSDVTSVGDSQAGSWGDMSSLVSLPMAASLDHAFDEFKYNGE
ncbi:hypothetical protein V2J09_007105 [Rumex salicifolius]